jgi:hypothetical protein
LNCASGWLLRSRRRQTEFGQAHVRVRDQVTGKVINVSRKEQKAFWEWSIVETLRHSGARGERGPVEPGGGPGLR